MEPSHRKLAVNHVFFAVIVALSHFLGSKERASSFFEQT
jgi:hypothetical protein